MNILTQEAKKKQAIVKYAESLVDFDRRAEDKTTSNILILGNSGQGKSYLLKFILTNLRESGKSVIVLDAEAEYEDLTEVLGGCYQFDSSSWSCCRITTRPSGFRVWR